MNSSENSPQDLIKYVPSAYFASAYASKWEKEKKNCRALYAVWVHCERPRRSLYLFFSKWLFHCVWCGVAGKCQCFWRYMLRTFSTHTWNVVVNPDSKPPRNRELRYFHRILHHMQTERQQFFFPCSIHLFILVFFFSLCVPLFLVNISKLWHAIQWNWVGVYANIEVCMNSFVLLCMWNFQLDLKLD